ncbi:MAG: hypothetical protein DCC88_11755 [Spirobacillus cienkowskii]|jgi:hypothetical protein|uniref:Uncharacterized protein n=1 Tax=Spirobacillus cienkowskii TaxID=495820 RepID=A0A369KMR1_9BACT|nr:MAG: hypothetical protein DCC88_11755 [Spirobacillus cienkowskii]
MSKKKTEYKIISAHARSADSNEAEELMNEAIKQNSKYLLVQIDGSKEKVIFSSNSKKECEKKMNRLKK